MKIYKKIRRMGAIYIHCARLYGPKPVFSCYREIGEYVIELPFTEIVLTPWYKLNNTTFKYDERKLGNEKIFVTEPSDRAVYRFNENPSKN